MAPLTINHPGGTILHLDDGSQEYFAYGAEVPDNISEAQRKHIANLADKEPRDSPDTTLMREAHRRASQAHVGPFSSVNPVPGDYHELDEEGAVNLMRVLEQWPRTQAHLVMHERATLGRTKVLEASTSAAREIADQLAGAAGDLANGAGARLGDVPPTAPPAVDQQGDGDGDSDSSAGSGTRAARRASQRATPPPNSGSRE